MSRSSENRIAMARPLKKRPLQVPVTSKSIPEPLHPHGDCPQNFTIHEEFAASDSNKRSKLEKQRRKGAAVLELLPSSITGSLGVRGFAVRNGKKHAPAKVMNPFDIPKADREEWKQEFCKMRDSGEPLENLPYLVYWYGRGTYELVSQSEFVPYDKAPSKLLRYADTAQQKRDKNLQLSKSERRRLDEMEELIADMGTIPDIPVALSDNPSIAEPEPKQLKANAQNTGTVKLIKRPRGRPPFGKVWDPVRGEYQPKSQCPQQDSQRLEHLLEVAKRDAKARLEREKAQVSRMLPDSVASQFGRVGFAKWGKAFLPALVLCPYHVPPGEARDTWVDQFNELKKNLRSLNKISLLVFWYGELNPSNFYSLVPISAFVPYHEATNKMLEFARKAEYKRASMKKLTDDDKQRIRAMQEMTEDLEKHPADRRRGIFNFKERHEMLTIDDMDDIDMNSQDDPLDNDDSCSVLDDHLSDEGSEHNRIRAAGGEENSAYSSLEDSDDDDGGDDFSSNSDEVECDRPGSRMKLPSVAQKAGQVSEMEDSDHSTNSLHDETERHDKNILKSKSDLPATACAHVLHVDEGLGKNDITPPQPTSHVVKSTDYIGDEILSGSRSKVEDEALAAIRSSGVSPALTVDAEHLPVLEVFTQIVKQVCIERDSALARVQQLEALLGKRRSAEMDKNPTF